MCTIFSLSDDKNAFGGNNEDYFDPHTRIWYIPREGGEIDLPVGNQSIQWLPGKYARNYCGYTNLFPQGGMNEMGLFFDFTATPALKMKKQGGKKQYKGYLIDFMCAECATVEEVLALCNEYSVEALERGCMFVGDATGDSVIIEGDEIIRKEGHFQVLTNFYQSLIKDPSDIRCVRYKIATKMLEEADNASVDTARRVLSAVRQAVGNYTVYSQVYDLKNQLIYLYHFHNFENELVIDPRKEWAKEKPSIYDIAELFPPTFAYLSYTAVYDFERSGERNRIVERKRNEGEIVDLDPLILDRYVGRYENDVYRGSYFEVYRRGDRLALDSGSSVVDAYPTSDTTFCIIDLLGERNIKFDLNDEGIVLKMSYDMRQGWSVPHSKVVA